MTDSAKDLPRQWVLVLARCAGAKPPGPSDVAESVGKIAWPGESKGVVRERVAAAIAQLTERGLLDAKRRLTEPGRAALCGALGVARSPSWKQVTSALLPALAMGLAPGSDEAKRALKDAESLQLALLRARLAGVGATTITQLGDALLAAAVGMPPGGKVSLDALRAFVVARALGEPPKGKAGELVARVAAASVRARKAGKGDLVAALQRQWAAADEPAVARAAAAAPAAADEPRGERAGERTDEPADEPADELGPTLHDLVTAALAGVRAPGRYGADKVFISELWRQLQAGGQLPQEMTYEQFQRWLGAANRRGELSLARADLVGAMDPGLVARSELAFAGATFHFVLDRNAATGEG